MTTCMSYWGGFLLQATVHVPLACVVDWLLLRADEEEYRLRCKRFGGTISGLMEGELLGLGLGVGLLQWVSTASGFVSCWCA